MINQEIKKLVDLQDTTYIDRIRNPAPNEPRYIINDQQYFSVTQILDDGRFRKANPVRLFQSKILGTITHLYIENYLKKNELDFNIDKVLEPLDYEIFKQFQKRDLKEWENYRYGLSDDLEEIFLINRIETAYNHFLKFMQDHQISFAYPERVIWNPILLYAGTIDLVCQLDGELTIIHHKTTPFINKKTNGFDPYIGQLSAYSHAIKVLTESTTDWKLKILHLNPMANCYELIERPYQISMFLDALCNFCGSKPSQDYLETHRTNGLEDTHTMYTGIDDVKLVDERSKMNNEETNKKEVPCKDKDCHEHSIFQISLKDQKNASTGVKILPKITYHENSHHYHLVHMETQNWNIINEFIINK